MTTKADLQLYLKLNELTKKGTDVKVPDASPNKFDAQVFGGASIVPDDQFGSSLHFDGVDDYIELPQDFNPGNTFTVESWVVSHAGPKTRQCFFGKHNSSGDNQILIGYWNEGLLVQAIGKSKTFKTDLPPANTWFHLAVTVTINKSNTNFKIYLDGNFYNEVTLGAAPNISKGRPWLLGQDWDKKVSSDFFNGHMTDVQFYSRALTTDEIKTDMDSAKSAHSVFKLTYPLDFVLVDNDVQNVLYIANTSDGTHDQLDLQISNTSTKTINLNPLPKPEANSENYHLELRFRPNTFETTNYLSASNKNWQFANIISCPENWISSKAILNDTNQTVSIFLSYSGKDPFVINPNQELNFKMEYGSADGRKGGRGTQVMLNYQHLQYSDSPSPINGNRVKQVDIVNQRGKKNIPLNIGFVGSNTVLNDTDAGGSYQGTNSTLKIRILNTLKKGTLKFNQGTNSLSATNQTKLSISFDSIDDERALGTADELAGIDVELINNWASVTKKLQATLPTIEIDDFSISELKAGDYLEILIKDVRSSRPSGFSNIYIHYEDIQGYWDGEFVLVVEKTPIIHRNVGDEKHVGIGVMPDKDYQLKLGGNLKIEADPDDKEMILVGSKDGSKQYLSVDKDGQVGIGTNTPEAPLTIKSTSGKEENPDDKMHITNDCILFGGNNKGKEINSGQISAGKHIPNSLNIIGVSSNKSYKNRRVDIWAEGDANVYGNLNVSSGKVQENGNDLIPKGCIMMWSGNTKNIPKGWVICDGRNGTPNLINRFVVGAGNKYSAQSRGGSETVTLTRDHMPSHNHGVNDPGHNHGINKMRNSSTDVDDSSLPMYARNTNNNTRTTTERTGISINSSGGNQPHNNMPPYYALCYIMKT